MAGFIFGLCAATSIVCALLLFRGWRASRANLLFWSALSFGVFAVNNILLVVDELILHDRDLGWMRDVTGFTAVAVLVVGLVWRGHQP